MSDPPRVRCEICGRPDVSAIIPRSVLQRMPEYSPPSDGVSVVCACGECAARYAARALRAAASAPS